MADTVLLETTTLEIANTASVQEYKAQIKDQLQEIKKIKLGHL